MNHGDRSMYVHGKCRCDLCRAANNRVCREVQRRLYAEGRFLRMQAEAAGLQYVSARAITHGTARGYTSYNCRCDPCRAAWSEYQRGWKRRKRARQP